MRPDGALYFTVLQAALVDVQHDAQDGQHVYFLSADRRHLVRAAEDLLKSNGIIGTPDGKTLYVADLAGKTYPYDITRDGHPRARRSLRIKARTA